MKDCTTCPHRAELNPQFAEMPWCEIPCSSCKLTEPPRHNMIEYGHQFEHPSENTWHIIDPQEHAEAPTERASLLMHYLASDSKERAIQRLSPPNYVVSRFVSIFSPSQELDVIDMVLLWDKSLEYNGRARGRSRVAQFKAMQKIRAMVKELEI